MSLSPLSLLLSLPLSTYIPSSLSPYIPSILIFLHPVRYSTLRWRRWFPMCNRLRSVIPEHHDRFNDWISSLIKYSFLLSPLLFSSPFFSFSLFSFFDFFCIFFWDTFKPFYNSQDAIVSDSAAKTEIQRGKLL